MRVGFWRRLAAALALVLGIGVAAPMTQAAATPKLATSPTPSVQIVVVSSQNDWWWWSRWADRCGC